MGPYPKSRVMPSPHRIVLLVTAVLAFGVTPQASGQPAPAGEAVMAWHVTIDAGEFVPIPPFFTAAEAAMNYLNAVGIRLKMRPMERAAFYAAWREKKLPGLFLTGMGNSGNAATRVETVIYSKGAYAYGGYPDVDDMFQQQSRERDPRRREALLHRIQQLTIDRVMFAPIMDLRALMGVGPRVTEHTITSVPMSPFPSYEDMRLKAQ